MLPIFSSSDVLPKLLERGDADQVHLRARMPFRRARVTVEHQPLRRPEVLRGGQEGGRIRAPQIIRAHASEVNRDAVRGGPLLDAPAGALEAVTLSRCRAASSAKVVSPGGGPR